MFHFSIGERVKVKSEQDITQILAMSYCRHRKPGCGPDGLSFSRTLGDRGMFQACGKTATITDIRRHIFGDRYILVLLFDDHTLDTAMQPYTFSPWMVSK